MMKIQSRADSTEDLTLGFATAGSTAVIYAPGAIIESDRLYMPATVTADSIELIAMDGGIGTEDDPFEVDTQNGLTKTGMFAAYGTELYITEISGDMLLLGLESTEGDIVLTVPGSIEELDTYPDPH